MQVRMKPDAAGPASELDDLARSGPVPLARIAPDGTVLWANEATLALLGLGADELFGQPLPELCPDAPGAQALLEAMRTGRGATDQPLRLRAKDGSARHVLVHINVRRGADGAVQDARCALRDVTARVEVAQARERLMQEAVLDPPGRDGVAPAMDGYLHFAPDWTITFARLNVGPERSAAIVGKTLWDVYPDVRGSEFEAHYRGAMADRKPRTFRAHYVPQDLWIENRLYPAGDGLALFYRDVGWHVDVERQLRERNRQQAAVARLGGSALRGTPMDRLLEEALAAVADVLSLDLLGVMEQVPGGFRIAAVHGYPAGLRGRLLPATEFAQSVHTLEQGRATVVDDLATETRFTPSTLLLAHGAVSGLTVPLHGPAGPYGILGGHARSARRFSPDDVTFVETVAHLLSSAMQRQRAEDELRLHRDQLEAVVAERTAALELAYREMEAFNYTVSHDLRAPLRAIGGFGSLLQHRYGPQLPPEASAMLDQVRAGVDRMGQLIEDLLELGRLQRLAPARVDVDLSALAQEVGEDLRRGTGRDVELAIQPGLVASAEPALLRIVLENLLGNAWKFTRDAGQPRVEVAAVPGTAAPTFCVRDNGAGFAPERAGRLFEPFHRLHAQHEFEGTGVGLATVRRIVERHGGKVSAHGTPGAGAEFRFSLPAPA